MHTYLVNEIFHSLQGEGLWSGTPMVFLRFSLCNLRCPFCDTDFSSGDKMTAEEILSKVRQVGGDTRRVCMTGGEPSLQIDSSLVDAFHREGYAIHIETNGTRKLPDGIDWITVSPKRDWQQKAQVVLERADELKLVYTGPPQDPSQWLSFNADSFLLQPCSMQNTSEVVSYVLSHPRWRLSLQTHKYLDIR